MNRETKTKLLNHLIEIKGRRKVYKSLFMLYTENPEKIDHRVIDELLDAELKLRKQQEIIEILLK